ncbi:MAG: H-NS histone family protein [Deltaproteobacteria bacterium]
MAIDLSGMSLKELKAHLKLVEAAIANYNDKAMRDARLELEELAKKHGFSLSELASVKKPRAKRAPSTVIYKNPKNPDQTWTGRGRKPLWVVGALSSGKTLKDMQAK